MAECNSELSGRRSWSIPLTVIGPSPSSVRCSSEGPAPRSSATFDRGLQQTTARGAAQHLRRYPDRP
ncbi:hypothetical protein I552_0394 [Mycobacterium xenopi 3993]|nr:hypothetical protein I552_0394 [Mycobacterium xenopi 3993]